MKRFLVVILVAALCFGAADAQELTKKEKKALKQEIALYQSQGWSVAPGNLSMAEQITRSKSYIKALDENGEPKYIIAETTVLAETYKAGMQSAQSAIKMVAANALQGELAAITETSLANSQASVKDAVSVDEVVTAAKDIVATSLPRGILLVSMYREVKNNVELRLMYAYSYAKVNEIAKNAARQTLKEKIDNLNKKLQ